MTSRQTNLLILAFLIIVGAATRLFHLGDYTYHVDEQFTIELVVKPLLDVLIFGLSKDCNPPLFYVIDWFSVHLLGFTPFAERLPAMIFGTLCIPATYLLGKELRDEHLGLMAAAVITFLGSMWYYSQFGRAYTMMIFLFTLAMIFYIRLLRGDTSRSNWLWYGSLATLCVWSHLYTLIPLGFMGLYLFWLYGWESVKKPLLAYLPSVGLAGTFYAIKSERSNIMQNWMGMTPVQVIEFTPLEYFSFSMGLFIPMIGISAWQNRQDKVVLPFLGIWLATFIALVIISMITPVFVRYTLMMVPMLVVIALDPLNKLIHDESQLKAQRAFAFVMLFAVFLIITGYQFWSGVYEGRNI